jgi:vacuolar-type H+-ATPase subunit C/Vma6
MKITEKDLQMFEYGFLWNGFVSWDKMKEAYKNPLENLTEAMKYTDYSKIVNEGLKQYNEKKSLIFLEKEIESYLIDYIKKSKINSIRTRTDNCLSARKKE